MTEEPPTEFESTITSKMPEKKEMKGNDSSLLKLIIVVFSCVTMLYLFNMKGYIWFSFHFIAMIIAFILLPGLAFLIKKAGGYANTKNHGYLMALSTMLSLFGFYVIYSNKDMYGKEHFTTTHGQLGLVVTLIYLGLALFSFPSLNVDWGIFKGDKTVRFLHKWTGRLATAAAWICCVYGFNTMVADKMIQILFATPLAILSFYVLL